MIFGCAAPDTGNAEIVAMFGTPEQKRRYLQPLLDGDIFSTYAMTEPQAGADPKEFTCRAWREDDEWVIEGEKWYASNYKNSSFVIAMVITNPENAPHERMSMFLIPSDTPGIVDIRDVAGMNDPVDHGHHAYLRFDKVRVPLDAMLGGPGEGFKLAQARLGGGSWADCDRLFAEVTERWGGAQVLVNNAGKSPIEPSSLETSEAAFDHIIAVNLRSAFRLSALFGSQMAEHEGGAIINISSTGALRPEPYFAPYAAAKSALHTLTACFAKEYGPKVRVNTVMPGPFHTDGTKSWSRSEGFSKHAETNMPLGRAASPKRSSAPSSTSPAASHLTSPEPASRSMVVMRYPADERRTDRAATGSTQASALVAEEPVL